MLQPDAVVPTAAALSAWLDGHDGGPVILAAPGFTCDAHWPVDDIASDARDGSRVLTHAAGPAPVRLWEGRVVACGTAQATLVRSDTAAAGLVRFAADDMPLLQRACRELPAGPPGPLWQQVLSVAVMLGFRPAAVRAEPFRATCDGGVLPEATDGRSKQAVRSVRGGDGVVSEALVRPVSRRITPWAVRWGLRPNQVTALSLTMAAVGILLALTGTRWGYAVAAVAMLASLVLDCVDGEVARWTHTYSRAGAWLDAVGDRVKEYGLWAAVAVSAASRSVWAAVIACLVLYTVKHFLDYGWSLRSRPAAHPAVAVTADPDPWAAAGQPTAAPARLPRWRRVLGMPIAERWLVVCVLLPFLPPLAVFGVLGALGLVSLLYTVLARLRASRDPVVNENRGVLALMADLGPLAMRLPIRAQSGWGLLVVAALLYLLPWLAGDAFPRWALIVPVLLALVPARVAAGRGPRGRLGWMAPAESRFLEMTGAVAVASALAVPAGPLFALLAAVAWREYDVVYRVRHQAAEPSAAVRTALLGADGRLLAASVLAVWAPWAWLLLAGYVAAVAVWDSARSWLGRQPA